MGEGKQTVHKIEATPICKEDGAWVVHFAGNGKHIGSVKVFNCYTKSGWDEGISEDIQIDCEAHAVQQYQAVMAERFRLTLLEQMTPGSQVVVVPISRGGVS